MKTLLGLIFVASLILQDSAFAMGRSGVFAKFKQLPAVQRVGEVWQGTGRGLAHKALALGLLGLATCGTIGCGGDGIDGISRADMLENTNNYYVGRHVYFVWSSTGEYKMGYVLGVSDDHEFFLVQLEDGTELTVSEHVIGGELLVGHTDVGAPVELVGKTSNEILSGVITAAYGDYEEVGGVHQKIIEDGEDGYYYYYSYIGDDRVAVASGFVVRLDDSGEEVFVPAGNITAWLND